MNVNFDDKVRTFKALNEEVLRQNGLGILVVARASQILGARVYDVRQAVEILENKGVKISSLFADNGKALTLKTVCIDVLNPPETNERGESKEGWKVRYEKGELMKRIYNAKGEINIEVEEISMIKRLIAASTYSNVILNQAIAWLEGKEKDASPEKDIKK